MLVSVQNGTNAGNRQPLKAKAADWRCPGCRAHNRYYWLRCPVCSHPRTEV